MYGSSAREETGRVNLAPVGGQRQNRHAAGSAGEATPCAVRAARRPMWPPPGTARRIRCPAAWISVGVAPSIQPRS